jgi:hypothetical protein
MSENKTKNDTREGMDILQIGFGRLFKIKYKKGRHTLGGG